jgi:hypothetical protein
VFSLNEKGAEIIGANLGATQGDSVMHFGDKVTGVLA